MPPPAHVISRAQVLIANSRPWTQDFRHVTAVIPRGWRKDRTTFYMPRLKDVRPKDRIKYWNIVPGDTIRLLGDAEGTVHEVAAVNKFTNRVYLRTENDEEPQADKQPRIKNVHYSKCQLLVGRFSFPPAPGSNEPRQVPVFATRLSTSKPFWLPQAHRFQWTRFAVGTTPRLPDWERGTKERIAIPWPERALPMILEPGPYDTTVDAVAAVTYVPPTLPSDPKAALPRVPSEHDYIKSLHKRSAFDLAAPVELYLHKELSNPHSRAKKQARWKAQQQYKRTLLDEMIKEEYANLAGRTRKDAKAEAIWKWRNRLIEERKAEMKRRWVNRGAEAREQNRKARKARKAERLRRKLQNLVLEDAPNQVIPGSATA